MTAAQRATISAAGPNNSQTFTETVLPGNPSAAATASIWSARTVPGTVTESDPNAVDLGMKFRSDVAGSVIGIRFYKGPHNTGRHTGYLWTKSGKLIGAVTFSAETVSGWQQANFANPVSIQANTTYIVSYYAPNGYYSADDDFFQTGVDNGPLHALKSGADGPNGVYVYGASSFPTESWNASNYWVDVVFSPSGTVSPGPPPMQSPVSVWSSSTVPGTITESDPNAVEIGMKFRSDVAGSAIGIRFYKGPYNTGQHTGHLWTQSGKLLGTVMFSAETVSGWQQANFAKPVSIQANTTYVVSYYAPNGYYSADDYFFQTGVDNAPLHALKSGAAGPNGVYVYGSSSFPTESWHASNYWVDVVFSPSK
ncbi:MAG: DUF4082 domain-containing protein [Bryobacteraceae bacterium]